MKVDALSFWLFFAAIFCGILVWKRKTRADAVGTLFYRRDRFSSSSDDYYHREEAYLRGGSVAHAKPTVVPTERIAPKLRGYFELAKQEIDKAVRAEEWALPDVAVNYYKNAHKILLEAKGTPVPSTISFVEQGKIDSYRQKINKWHEKVLERLEALGDSGAGTSTNKTELPHLQIGTSPESLGVEIAKSHSPSFRRNSVKTEGQSIKFGRTQTAQKYLGSPDAKLVTMINTAIVDKHYAVRWDDVAGLFSAKQTLLEMIVLPMRRRDLFTGLRRPAKGLLLFGPPGSGKTMLAKAIASKSEATFFYLSASSLMSKWVKDAEKLVRTLFMVAIARQPSIIFMDEIDSVMSMRLDNENDASRRIKSEFLNQYDRMTDAYELVFVIGATNKPQELDDAVLRRLHKRIYVPLPDENARRQLLKHQLEREPFTLQECEVERLVIETEGYSASDLQALCEHAAMMPIRELGTQIMTLKVNQVQPVRYEHFCTAMTGFRPSLQKRELEGLEQWNREFGSN